MSALHSAFALTLAIYGSQKKFAQSFQPLLDLIVTTPRNPVAADKSGRHHHGSGGGTAIRYQPVILQLLNTSDGSNVSNRGTVEDWSTLSTYPPSLNSTCEDENLMTREDHTGGSERTRSSCEQVTSISAVDVDVLLAKVSSSDPIVRQRLVQWIDVVNERRACLARPPLIVVDHPNVVDEAVLSRARLNTCVLSEGGLRDALRTLGVAIPPTIVLGKQHDKEEMVRSELTGPFCIIKPDLSNGPAETHDMSIIPLALLQRFIDTYDSTARVVVQDLIGFSPSDPSDGPSKFAGGPDERFSSAVVYKVYAMGHRDIFVTPLSVGTFYAAVDKHFHNSAVPYSFNSQNKALFPSSGAGRVRVCSTSAPGESTDSEEEWALPISKERLRVMVALLCRRTGLGLIGIDLIFAQQGEDHIGMVLDINYFPGYKTVPMAEERLLRYLTERALVRGSNEMETERN